MLADSLLGMEDWYSSKCTLIWKVRVTKSKRLLFQLVPSTPRTAGTASGLLPTKTTTSYGTNQSPSDGAAIRPSLESLIKILPTPAAADGQGGKKHKQGTYSVTGKTLAGGKIQVSLQDRLQMLGTPRARDGNEGSKGSIHNYQKGYLDGQIQEMPNGHKAGLKLQPAFALWMMGYPEDWLDLEAGEMPRSKARATPSSPKSPRK